MEKTFQFNELDLTLPKIFEEMGYKSVQPEKQIVELTQNLLDEISTFTRPQCTYKIIDENPLTTSAVISYLLKNSERFVIFAATAGKAFGEYQQKNESDILKSFIINVIGTCIVESAGDRMEKLIETEIGGEKHTARYSPGYCGWRLDGQKELFAILGDNPCGIELTDVCLMLPIKSISGVIGVGKNVVENQYGCRFCEMDNCYKKDTKLFVNSQ
jgi:hypothetical protein